MSSYRLTNISRTVNGHLEFRIESLDGNSASETKIGEYGGWIESEANLQQDSTAWIADDAVVYGNAVVKDNALVKDNAILGGNVIIKDNSIIGGDVFIEGDLMIGGNVRIFNKFPIGDAKVITNFMSVYNFEDFVTLSFFGEDDGTIFVSDGDETLMMKDFFNIVKKANINPRSVETYRMLCSLVQLRFNCKKHERVMKKEMRNFD